MASGLMPTLRRAFGIAAILVAGAANAEPYLAVYKGMQCSTCHSQQAGGGMRNVYGNAFAQSEMPAQRVGGWRTRATRHCSPQAG